VFLHLTGAPAAAQADPAHDDPAHDEPSRGKPSHDDEEVSA
jgi:hypothetical protein